MKNLLTLTALLALLAGCAKEEVSVAAVEEPAAEPSNMLVEYMWCKAGENYSQENHMALNADWNAREAASQHQTSGAFGLIPKEPNDNYDGIWANVWASQEARDARWQEWLENEAADFAAKHDATLTCDPERVFLFEVEQVVAPAAEWEGTGPFQAMYQFCKLNEGMTMANVDSAQAVFVDWVAAGRAAEGANGFMSTSLTPMFDPATTEGAYIGADFYQGAFWRSEEEKAAGMAGWMAEGGEAREMFEATATCEDFHFDLYGIKEMG